MISVAFIISSLFSLAATRNATIINSSLKLQAFGIADKNLQIDWSNVIKYYPRREVTTSRPSYVLVQQKSCADCYWGFAENSCFSVGASNSVSFDRNERAWDARSCRHVTASLYDGEGCSRLSNPLTYPMEAIVDECTAFTSSSSGAMEVASMVKASQDVFITQDSTSDVRQFAVGPLDSCVTQFTSTTGEHHSSIFSVQGGTLLHAAFSDQNCRKVTGQNEYAVLNENDPWTLVRTHNVSVVVKSVPQANVHVDGRYHNSLSPRAHSLSLSPRPSAQPTGQPYSQPSNQPTFYPTAQPSSEPSSQPSGQPSLQPTFQPSIQPFGQPSSQPTVQPSTQPSCQPSVQPSSQPFARPTSQPTFQPTQQPTSQPSAQPTQQPTNQPSTQPSSQPSIQPTQQPSSQPSRQPSGQPTYQPSRQPTEQPSMQPSRQPTSQPSNQPRNQPSSQPTFQPTCQPSRQPSTIPSSQPSFQPSIQPNSVPSAQPSSQPSCAPSLQPSSQPSIQPNNYPTIQPTRTPTTQPTHIPTGQPSDLPSPQPTSQPSLQPSVQPTLQPISQPSNQPSRQPTSQPSHQPVKRPSSQPTKQPLSRPTSQPRSHPTNQPSSQPSTQPSEQPSSQPTFHPTDQPSTQPQMQPSSQPSARPTCQPHIEPSTYPTSQPSDKPTGDPTAQPSASPTHPSSQPTRQPSRQPSKQPHVRPSTQPTAQPMMTPVNHPSGRPTMRPSTQPSNQPSQQPVKQPISQPSTQPSVIPSMKPSVQPSCLPTYLPTGQPSQEPSDQPLVSPSQQPTAQPMSTPTSQPVRRPSRRPSSQPIRRPTSQPSHRPSKIPSSHPTHPTSRPSSQPALHPTGRPSRCPSHSPSSQPSRQPSLHPSAQPSRQPQTKPSRQPSKTPSSQPSRCPSASPSNHPTKQPSRYPSLQPVSQPSSQPSQHPSHTPTRTPATMVPTPRPTQAQPLAPIGASRNSFAANQTLIGVTSSAWKASGTSSTAFIYAVASALPGISPSAISISSVQDAVSVVSTPSAFRAENRVLSSSTAQQLRVKYTVGFDPQALGFSNTVSAYTSLVVQLSASISTGQFTALLRSHAAALSCPALMNATAGSLQIGAPVTKQLGPTLQPTGASKSNTESTLHLGKFAVTLPEFVGFAVGISILVPLLCLLACCAKNFYLDAGIKNNFHTHELSPSEDDGDADSRRSPYSQFSPQQRQSQQQSQQQQQSHHRIGSNSPGLYAASPSVSWSDDMLTSPNQLYLEDGQRPAHSVSQDPHVHIHDMSSFDSSQDITVRRVMPSAAPTTQRFGNSLQAGGEAGDFSTMYQKKSESFELYNPDLSMSTVKGSRNRNYGQFDNTRFAKSHTRSNYQQQHQRHQQQYPQQEQGNFPGTIMSPGMKSDAGLLDPRIAMVGFPSQVPTHGYGDPYNESFMGEQLSQPVELFPGYDGIYLQTQQQPISLSPIEFTGSPLGLSGKDSLLGRAQEGALLPRGRSAINAINAISSNSSSSANGTSSQNHRALLQEKWRSVEEARAAVSSSQLAAAGGTSISPQEAAHRQQMSSNAGRRNVRMGIRIVVTPASSFFSLFFTLAMALVHFDTIELISVEKSLSIHRDCIAKEIEKINRN